MNWKYVTFSVLETIAEAQESISTKSEKKSTVCAGSMATLILTRVACLFLYFSFSCRSVVLVKGKYTQEQDVCVDAYGILGKNSVCVRGEELMQPCAFPPPSRLASGAVSLHVIMSD